MPRNITTILAALLIAVAVHAQSTRPQFEVASIKTDRTFNRSNIQITGDRFVATALPLRALIHQAYDLADYQIVGAPGWIDTDQWDIEAKSKEAALPPIAPQDPNVVTVTRLMLQSLIEDRFKFQFHRETRALPVYVLTVAKNGVKASLSPDQSPVRLAEARSITVQEPMSRGSVRLGMGEMNINAQPFSYFVYLLSRQLGRALIDKTGLKGLYDIQLRWNSSPTQSRDAVLDQPLLTTALQEQLGLKLESARGPVEVLVIDSVSRPTEN